MKKLLALVLAVVTVFALASCTASKTTNYGKECLSLASQYDALNGLVKGDADIAVIDSVMANYYVSTDAFKEYQVIPGFTLSEESFGIAAKKGNKALIGKVNEAIIALADTDYKTVGAAYGLTNDLLVKADTVNPEKDASDGSWDKIVNDKKIIIGYTEFAPIAYYEGDGADAVFKGFDTDLAKAVFAYLNSAYNAEIEVQFLKIEWDQKETDIENGTIDLIWNGMTITDDLKAGLELSIPYLSNNQVAVIAKSAASAYADVKDPASFKEAAKDAVIAVESGSAGEALVIG